MSRRRQVRNGVRLAGGAACHNVPHLGHATICSVLRSLLLDFGMSSGWLKSTLLRASLHALHIRAPGLGIGIGIGRFYFSRRFLRLGCLRKLGVAACVPAPAVFLFAGELAVVAAVFSVFAYKAVTSGVGAFAYLRSRWHEILP
jgi:hypothetical protein